MTVTAPAHPVRPSSPLVVAISAENGATVMSLRGEADVANLKVLTDSLARVIADHHGAVVIDLAGALFLDTAVVRAIARAGRTLENQGRHLSVRSATRLAQLMLANLESDHLVEG